MQGIFTNMHKVRVYGEIVPYQDGWVVENGFCNLTYVEAQLAEAKGKDVEVGINSMGGDVEEGFAIYGALRRYAKDNKAKVVTRADGRCSSIATVVFLAGDTRIVSKYIEPFVHNAWTYQEGDANDFKRISVELEIVNERIAKFYAEHTNLTYEEARTLMDAETFITPEEAINIRFATEIEEVLRPVALEKFKTKNSMKKDEKSILAKLKEIFASEAKNVEVFTSTNEALVFADLEDGQSPKVGDKATIDGKAAEGSYTLADGTVYVFVAGELTEIVEKEDDGDDEMEALRQENAELKAKLEANEATLNTQSEEIKAIQAKQKEFDKKWNKLNGLVSEVVVDDKDDKDKSPKNKDKKPGLAGAASKLKV